MTAKTRAIMEVSHAISQLRSIIFMAKDIHIESVKWLTPEIKHAVGHLEQAINYLDKVRNVKCSASSVLK